MITTSQAITNVPMERREVNKVSLSELKILTKCVNNKLIYALKNTITHFVSYCKTLLAFVVYSSILPNSILGKVNARRK